MSERKNTDLKCTHRHVRDLQRVRASTLPNALFWRRRKVIQTPGLPINRFPASGQRAIQSQLSSTGLSPILFVVDSLPKTPMWRAMTASLPLPILRSYFISGILEVILRTLSRSMGQACKHGPKTPPFNLSQVSQTPVQ